MLPYVLSTTGWLAFVFAVTTTVLAYALRPSGLSRFLRIQTPTAGTISRRLGPHIILGAGIAILALAHTALAMSLPAAAISRFDQPGLWFATLALALVLVQAMSGTRLTQRLGAMRAPLRRWHLWTMSAILTAIAAHIALNSALVHAMLGL